MASLQKEEETNWSRACRLLLEGGRDVLLLYLQNFWSSNNHSSLDAFLATHRTQLTSPPASYHIHGPQISILFPASGRTNTDDWDITLAAAIVQNCILTIPNTSAVERNSLNKIRGLRNRIYGHSNKMEMNATEFTQNWTDICTVLSQAARDFGLTLQQFDLQSKSDNIRRTVVVDGDELRKQFHDWYSSDIVQGQAEIKKVLREGRVEQRKENAEIKTVIQEGREEQRKENTEMKTVIQDGREEQRKENTEMKTVIQEGREEQRKENTEMKTVIQEGREEQRKENTEIKTVIQEGREEQRKENTEIKTVIQEGREEQRKENTEMKTVIQEGREEQRKENTEIKTVIQEGREEQRKENTEMKTVIQDGREEQRKENTEMKTVIQEGREEQRKENTEMKTVIQEGREEQRKENTEIKTVIQEGREEQRKENTEIKTVIQEGREEQRKENTEMKTVIQEGREEQRKENTEIKTVIQEGREEQRKENTEMKTVIQDGREEQRKENTEMKTVIQEGREEQRKENTEIKTVVQDGREEQRKEQTEMKTVIQEGREEQRKENTEIKTVIQDGREEQRKENTEIKTVIQEGREEQWKQNTEIKTVVQDGRNEQRKENSDIKRTLEEGQVEQKEMTTKIKDQVEKLLTQQEQLMAGRETICQRVTSSQECQSHVPSPTETAHSGARPKTSICQFLSRKVADFVKFVNPKASTSSVTEQHVDVKQQHGTQLPSELKTLQSNLVKYYKRNQIKSPLVVHSSSSQTDIDEIYAKPRLVLVDHRALTKESSKETAIAYRDIFQQTEDKYQQIYISGDAGVGKTSFCKHLVASWCIAHSQEPITDDHDDMVFIMEKFDFLFYVTLRHANDQYELNEMIVTQLLAQTLQQSSIKNKRWEEFLEELFELYSERCLIVLDGLDEWTAPRDSPLPSVSNGLPGRSLQMNYTIVTTTRPWKLAVLRLQDTEIDKKIELRGVEEVKDFTAKLIYTYNKQHNVDKRYIDFEDKLNTEGLSEMKDTPILLKQLLCLWYNDYPFGKSKTDVYTNMIELLFERAEIRENVTGFNVQSDSFDIDLDQTHPYFRKGGKCEKYKALLLKLGKLAFETMFSGEHNFQLVFESSEAETHDIHRKYIDTCTTVGILTRSVVPDMVCHRESLSFLHKTFHEYFAALYMSVYHSSISDLKTRVGQACRSIDSMFDMWDMFQFLSGMCPFLMKSLSDCLVEAINNDEKVHNERHEFNQFNKHNLRLIQSIMLSCCKESSDNGHSPLHLPVPDLLCDINSFINNEPSTFVQCLQCYPSYLRSIYLTGKDWSLNQLNHDTQQSEEISSQYTEKSSYHIDLSKYGNLSSVTVECQDMSQIVLKLNENQLTCLSLEKVSSSLIIPSIKAATKLKSLCLRSVVFTDQSCNEMVHMDSCKCRSHISRVENEFDLDLSEHSRLVKPEIEDISPGSVTLSPSIRSIVLANIHTLTHDAMWSLMSSISNAHSLEEISLTSVKCKDHPNGAGCRYKISLSEHNRLSQLTLKDISPESVTLSPSLRYIDLRNIHTLTHDAMCSLMSSLSNAHSLEDISVMSVKCKNHPNRAGCRYQISLSEHSRLSQLTLDGISPESVTLSPSLRAIYLSNIHTLTHDAMCSLMSSLSNAHSLEEISVASVKCKDHPNGAGCRYQISLSEHSRLSHLLLGDISPESVTLSPSLGYIYLSNIHTLTHDGMCSLMSSLSNAHLLDFISLTSVKCKDHPNRAGCRYKISLSEHSRLSHLLLGDISPESVTLSPSLRAIDLGNIHTLTHDAMCSLMSCLSNAHSLEDISVMSVKCKNHPNRAGCRYQISLSEHSRLSHLLLDGISLESVTLCPSLRNIYLSNIHTLTHDAMCSLMSSLSNAHSLGKISLASVKCKDHPNGAGCRYQISLSEHSRLSRLILDDISPESVTLNPSLRNMAFISLTNIHTLTHDAMCSLMLLMDNKPSRMMWLSLSSVRCIDYMQGVKCGKEVKKYPKWF